MNLVVSSMTNEIAKGMIKKVLSVLYACLAIMVSMAGVKRTRYIFCSKHGFTDNTKYLFIYHVMRGHDCVWVYDEKKDDVLQLRAQLGTIDGFGYQNVELLKRNSLRLQVALTHARVVFVSHSFRDLGAVMSKSAKVVNLWHGIPLKKMGFDSKNDKELFSLREVDNPYLINDYVIASSSKTKKDMVSCMLLPPERVLPFGLPRNDILVEEQNNSAMISELRRRYKIRDGGRLYLYAPTFRDDRSEALDIYSSLIQSFKSNARYEDRLVLRLHPNERDIVKSINLSEGVIVSEIEDVQEEMLAVDCLISDYSSMIFDFRLMEKPIFVYAPDLEVYRNNRGGFYFDFDEIFSCCIKIDDKNLSSVWHKDLTSIRMDPNDPILGLHSKGSAAARIYGYFTGNSGEPLSVTASSGCP